MPQTRSQTAKAPLTDPTAQRQPRNPEPKKTNTITSQTPPSATMSQEQTPLFFYSPNKPHGFMSQWYPSTFTDPTLDTTFTSAEQYMMYRKAVMAGDEKSKTQILECNDPKKVKAMGRKVRNFDSQEWDRIKFDAVTRGNYLKFTQCEDELKRLGPLKAQLLETGDEELVEAAAFDRIWGIGYAASGAMDVPRVKWGKNLLGRALMEVRQMLREEEKTRTESGKEETTV